MPTLYTVQVRTHTGGVRVRNEDAVSTVLDWRTDLELRDEDLQERGHLFAVADGMGGHAAGEIASQLAVETLFRSYYARDGQTGDIGLAAAIAAANQALYQKAEDDPTHAGMGTTLVAGLLHGSDLLIANVGDSRAYLFHNGRLARITQDHSWVSEQIAAGVIDAADAARHPYRNVVTRSLGPDRDPRPDLFHLSPEAGDLLLLCSDGLSNLIGDEELAQFLGSYPPDEAANILLQQALERGAPDNVSFALIEFQAAAGVRRRQAWPWLLSAFLLIGLLVGLFRQQLAFLLPGTGVPPTPAVIATDVHPVLSPSPAAAGQSPLVTPTPAAPVPAPLADPIRVDILEFTPVEAGTPSANGDNGGAAPNREKPLREDYVLYLQGPVQSISETSAGWQIGIPHRSAGAGAHTYGLSLSGDWLPGVTPPPTGTQIAVIAWPVDETDLSGDIALQPRMLLSPATEGWAEALWVENGDLDEMLAELEAVWVFTVYGPGGAEGLDVRSLDELLGRLIALRGGWRQPVPDSGWVFFGLEESTPYEWQGDAYRQPDN